MIFNNPYMKIQTKIQMLQRWILVHSFLYYEMNCNVVTDNVYDANAQQLIKMQKENPEIKTDFSYAFKDFESGTGFNLIYRLKDEHKKIIEKDALIVLSAFEKVKRH